MTRSDHRDGGLPPRVLITTTFLVPGDEVDARLRTAGYEVLHSPDLSRLADSEQSRLLATTDAVIAGTSEFTAALMDRAPRLKVIARTGVGYDNVDVGAASERDIVVCTTPGANRQSVAEHVFTLMLACARALPADLDAVRDGHWPQRTGRELHASTLGIVGLGTIGKSVAAIAKAFGMNVLAHDPSLDEAFAEANNVESVDLSILLRRSDFVTLHLFLDDSTRHLIDARALARMKCDAYLINTSRGGVVDEAALADAVRNGRLAGAALDVFETEPLPIDSPLRQEPAILTTGHIAGATREARSRSGQVAATCVIEALEGRPISNAINLREYASRPRKAAQK
jgi:D-3-phosphoglycerate dehydrogenase